MDLEKIQQLLKLMETHDLGELEVKDTDFEVRLKKAETGRAYAPANSGAPALPGPSPTGPAKPPDGVHTIASPIVGTFYRAPSPEAEQFVDVGDPVEAETVVCIVEAMKVMNEVKAEVQGTIQKILVENGKPVEYGQALFFVAR